MNGCVVQDVQERRTNTLENREEALNATRANIYNAVEFNSRDIEVPDLEPRSTAIRPKTALLE